VRDLKHFIEFAQQGPKALAAAVRGSVGGYDSPFEEAVADGLRGLGWQVVPQIGVSRFRIDLGIVHPDRPGDYLAGVECDGATYHSAATARDRDKVRGAILRGLGWNLVRLWSTEWWVDKAGALQRLDAALTELLEASRAAQAAVVEAEPAPEIALTFPVQTEEEDDRALEPASAWVADEVVVPEPEALPVQALAPVTEASTPPGVYRVADLSALAAEIDAERFYQAEYDAVLQRVIAQIVDQEAPIRDTVLVQRVARAHGFQRAGRLIRDRVLGLAERAHHVQATAAEEAFVWGAASEADTWSRYRVPATEADVRALEDIAAPELRAAARAVGQGDTALEVAKVFGFKRLTAATRERLEQVLSEV
jgi:very-short-patch-repair endonuclease